MLSLETEREDGSSQPAARRSGWPLVAFAAMLWGTDILLRPRLFGPRGLTPAMVVLCEHVALTALFLPIVIARRQELRRATPRDLAALLFLAWAGSAVATILLTTAYRSGSPLVATLLQKTQPLFAVFLASIVLKERRKAVFWGWFAGALVATYLLSFGFTGPGAPSEHGSAAISALCALGAAAIWGACTVIGRYALKDISPTVVAGWRFVLAIPLLVALNWSALASEHGWPHSNLSEPSIWLPLIGIVLIPDLLGMTLYYVGLNRTPASIATVAELAYPISALILGLVFANQRLDIGQWAGLILLFGCLRGIQITDSVVETPSSTPHTARRGTDAPAPLQGT
jgi:drug/metabolite transporter (DMT)-like permease